MSLEKLTEDLRVFAAERNWDRFHSPKNFAMALFNETGELLAPYTWVDEAEALVLHRDEAHHRAIASEVGDVMINIVQFCRLEGIDDLEVAASYFKPTLVHTPELSHNPKAIALQIGYQAACLMAHYGAIHRRAAIGQLFADFQVFCRLVEIDPLVAAESKLAKLRVRFDPEEQKASGGYVRRGEDGTPRESIRRN